MCPALLDAPRQELFIRVFKSAVALSVSRQIDFLCVCTGRTIQLYRNYCYYSSYLIPLLLLLILVPAGSTVDVVAFFDVNRDSPPAVSA